MEMKLNERVSLVVETYSAKQTRMLKKYGTVEYVSKRMHYAILYVDAADAADRQAALTKLKFVRRVSISPLVKLSEGFANDSGDEDLDED